VATLPIPAWFQTAAAHLFPQPKPAGHRLNGDQSRVEDVIAIGDKLQLMARFRRGGRTLLTPGK
jgi:hypothetical protein